MPTLFSVFKSPKKLANPEQYGLYIAALQKHTRLQQGLLATRIMLLDNA